MRAVEIRRYTAVDEKSWNQFVAAAKNATFLFNRKYMDYHSDRFTDHSLLVYEKNSLAAIFVANEADGSIESHGGLTYGGLVLRKDTRMEDVLLYFREILRYYSSHFPSVLYKCFPSYLADGPSNEDLYALFLLNAPLVRRDVASVLVRGQSPPYQKGRKHSLKKSTEVKFKITRSDNPAHFWEKVLIPNLNERFDAKPTHSVSEISMLMANFPDNIQLFELTTNEIVAGAVVFVMKDVVHTQYLSATAEAKENGLLDALVDQLLNDIFADKARFSFGTSNEEQGRKLNHGLINWKEGFGARAFTHDFYEIDTRNYMMLPV
jgi:hypothetical protein